MEFIVRSLKRNKGFFWLFQLQLTYSYVFVSWIVYIWYPLAAHCNASLIYWFLNIFHRGRCPLFYIFPRHRQWRSAGGEMPRARIASIPPSPPPPSSAVRLQYDEGVVLRYGGGGVSTDSLAGRRRWGLGQRPPGHDLSAGTYGPLGPSLQLQR